MDGFGNQLPHSFALPSFTSGQYPGQERRDTPPVASQSNQRIYNYPPLFPSTIQYQGAQGRTTYTTQATHGYQNWQNSLQSQMPAIAFAPHPFTPSNNPWADSQLRDQLSTTPQATRQAHWNDNEEEFDGFDEFLDFGDVVPTAGEDTMVAEEEIDLEANEEQDEAVTKPTKAARTTTSKRKGKKPSVKKTIRKRVKRDEAVESFEAMKKRHRNTMYRKIGGLRGFTDAIIGGTGTEFEDSGVAEVMRKAMEGEGLDEAVIGRVRGRVEEFLTRQYVDLVVEEARNR